MNVVGDWRLEKAVALSPGGEIVGYPYGPTPMGRLVLGANGRMMAVLCDGRAELPDGASRNYASYCGSYVIEGDTLVTTVDGAAIAERVGGKQVRRLRFEDGCLVLMPPRRRTGEQRELFWKRDGAA